MSTDVGKIWHNLLLHRTHISIQFDSFTPIGAWAAPGQTSLFVIPEMYHNSSHR